MKNNYLPLVSCICILTPYSFFFQVLHNFSGKMNPDGSIAGIPESWKKRLELMITQEEAMNPENAEKAGQILKWIDTRQGDSQDFMRVNSSPGNSAVLSSNSSHTSDEGFISISDSQEDSDMAGTEEMPQGGRTKNDSGGGSEPNPETGSSAKPEVTEVPTLRRKKTTRQGPRITRNLTDEDVLAQLTDICRGVLPWEDYQKVPTQP